MNFKENETLQKLRGGYYTPPDLADFLVRWVAAKSPRRILEPSCGDGVFFDSIAAHLDNPHLTGLELDAEEASRAEIRANGLGLSNARVVVEDFLGWALRELGAGGNRFDAVVGNPPFIRYQYLPAEFQHRSEEVFRALGCRFTKHTNAWVPFVLASIALLRPGGRLAMVVPAEIVHVLHAQSLRSYLGAECSRLVVVDPEELWFDGTLQGAVLLLAEKKGQRGLATEGLAVHSVRGRSFLSRHPEDIFRSLPTINGRTIAGKWTRAILPPSTISLLEDLEKLPAVKRFDDVAEVDVGIVTGANRFFLISEDAVRRHGLAPWVHPMFGRSDHCPGVIYDAEQHHRNVVDGKPTCFVWFRDAAVENDPSARAYIDLGISEKLHERYKCRIRKPWYSVPSVYATDVGMLKRSHDTPRLILNRLRAYTTDTAYRVKPRIGSAEELVFSFINSLTALSAELEGRHYGGGVLELVPSEIEKLLLPTSGRTTADVEGLDAAIRTTPVDAVLKSQSRTILGGIGLSIQVQEELLSGWWQLRNRRHRIENKVD